MMIDPRIHQSTPEPDRTDRAAVIEYLVAEPAFVRQHQAPFDEPAAREVATIVAERTRSLESSARNHYAAPGWWNCRTRPRDHLRRLADR